VTLTNIATGRAENACSPGGLAALRGHNLVSGGGESAASFPLPISLAGTQVRVNGQAARLLAVSSSQINFQCPSLAPDTALEIEIVPAQGRLSPIHSVMQAASPGLFYTGSSTMGNEIAIYASGLGELSTELPAGMAAPQDQLLSVRNRIEVAIGELVVEPTFAGAVPGSAGLFQVRVRVPGNITTGSGVPLYLRVTLPDGKQVASNAVTIPVSGTPGR